jgi:hypothetical protein
MNHDMSIRMEAARKSEREEDVMLAVMEGLRYTVGCPVRLAGQASRCVGAYVFRRLTTPESRLSRPAAWVDCGNWHASWN